jgi:hypothetical protein
MRQLNKHGLVIFTSLEITRSDPYLTSTLKVGTAAIRSMKYGVA